MNNATRDTIAVAILAVLIILAILILALGPRFRATTTTHHGTVLSVDCPQFDDAPSYAVMNESGAHIGYKISDKDLNCLVAATFVGQYVSFVVEHDWDTGDWIVAMSPGVHVFG